MKILAAAFTTALLVFAVASALSLTLLKTDEVANSESGTRRTPSRTKPTVSTNRSSRSSSRKPPAELSTDREENEELNAELQKSLHAVQQRERSLESRQATLDLAFEEIRKEQVLAERLRQQVTTELAALRDANRRIARRDIENSETRPVLVSSSRSSPNHAPSNSLLQLKDAQSIQDAANLIGRLAKDGGLRSAILLLQKMKERDAAKVLAALDKTDSQTAAELGERLLSSRNDETSRR